MQVYDLEALEDIPVQDVVSALGGKFPKDSEPGVKQYNMHCCNASFHKEDDKKPSLTIWKSKNICMCHVCGTAGNSISVAKQMHKGDFKEACRWLHDTFSIPYKSGSSYQNNQAKKFNKPKPKQIEYERFDKSLGFTHVEVKKFIDKYDQLNEQQRLKLVYTYLYRFSLTTDRKKLNSYYEGREINNPHITKIGYLSAGDVDIVIKKLKGLFPLEDLVKFEIIHNENHQYFPLQWRQLKECLVVPSFSIHTDLIEGMMFRPIDKESNKWFKGKEKRMSVASIVSPHPFGIGYGLLSKSCDIYITEGHIDAFSLPKDYCFVASPGVQTFKQKQLGLLKDRNIKLVFDQDHAGQQVAWGFTILEFLDQKLTILHNKQDVREDIKVTKRLLESQGIKVSQVIHEGFRDRLLKAGAKSVEVITWDKKLGKDVNDLVVNNNMSKVFNGGQN